MTTTAIAQAAVQWAIAHPDVMGWVGDNMESNDFAASLAGHLDRTGALTPRQIEAVRAKLSAAERAPAAVHVDVAAIERMFEAARARQVKKPAVRLDTFVFKFAGTGGRNPGAIYVTDTESTDADGRPAYLGKVLGGSFTKTAACSADQADRIVAAASNPSEAAKAYGQRTGNCSICGRELTAEESLEKFLGPVCAKKYGIS